MTKGRESRVGRNDGSPLADSEVEIVVEIPRGSRNKYEYDPVRHIFRFDRRLFSSTVYPADYGFIPDTLAEDGHPLDALVLVEDPTFPGCHVIGRPVALFWMTDEKGPDAKVICVPSNEFRWEEVTDLEHLPLSLRAEIQQFFDLYEEVERGKGTSTKGCEGRLAALSEIRASRERFDEGGPTREWVKRL